MLIRINSHSFALPRAGGLEVVFSERTRSGAYWGDRGLAPPLARPEDPAPLGGLLADALGAGLRALDVYDGLEVAQPPADLLGVAIRVAPDKVLQRGQRGRGGHGARARGKSWACTCPHTHTHFRGPARPFLFLCLEVDILGRVGFCLL